MSCTRTHTVVTGASSGIGRATALRLAGAGHHVYAGVRRDADGESLRQAAGSGELTPLRLDVTSADQLSAAADLVAGHVGAAGLDGLVNNAGIGVSAPLESISVDTLRRQFDVNVFGQVAVTQAFLPLLRRAPGRIVVIGSIGNRLAIPFGGALAASKRAVSSLADSLRLELAAWNIRVVLLEPASIHTEAVDKMRHETDDVLAALPADQRELYADSYRAMMDTALARERAGSPPAVVAAAVLTALTSARPRAHYLVGKDARLLATVARLPTPLLDAIRRRIFRLPAPGSRAVR